jgi:hypothetical protein
MMGRGISIRVCLLVTALVAAVAWPLLTYAFTLAAFGLAHVLTELRYLSLRFGKRVGAQLGQQLVAACAVIALGRMARQLGLLSATQGTVLELVMGLGLCAAVVPVLARADARRTVPAIAIVLALALGISLSPIHALLAIAVLHNVSPLALLADAAPPHRRAQVVAWASVVFVLVPLVVLSGAPRSALAALGLVAPELGATVWGPMEQHMRAYLPPEALSRDWALHAFSACVFLQCAHYLAVIDVLPRTLPARDRGWFSRLVPALAAVAFIAFALDFSGARGWYGVIAAVHAWVELPLILIAVALRPVTTSVPATARA